MRNKNIRVKGLLAPRDEAVTQISYTAPGIQNTQPVAGANLDAGRMPSIDSLVLSRN
jgi:hypothetical protein